MNNQMNNDGQVKQTMVSGAKVANANSVNKVQSGKSSSGIAKKIMPKSVKNDPKYTENWINVKTISNGIIYNDSGDMVTGVKIQPKNIFILDGSSMDNTLIGLMNFYNTINYEFWLVVADRPVDIAMYQAELQLLYNKTADQTLRKIISQDMDKGDYFKNNNVVDTEYYLLFKDKKMDVLQKRVRDMINGLAGAGLVASQTSNEDLRTIIDNFLNGGTKYESGTVMPL